MLPPVADQLTPISPRPPVTLAVKTCVALRARLAEDGETTTAISFTTVTKQLSVWLPSWVVTVIVAVPGAMPHTWPLLLTVATEALLLAHDTFLSVALAGSTVATSVSHWPTIRAADVLFRPTPVTGTETVMVQLALWPPSCAVTVIVAVPADTPVTRPLRPLPDTVAMAVLLLVQATPLFVALLGITVATRLSCAFRFRARVFLLRVRPVTDISGGELESPPHETKISANRPISRLIDRVGSCENTFFMAHSSIYEMGGQCVCEWAGKGLNWRLD